MNATLTRKTTRQQFESDLMRRYDGDVVCKIGRSDGDDKTKWMYLFYTTHGLTDQYKQMGIDERHCGTWEDGEGWEFLGEGK
tara:strand:- start:74 stop:319 length:246 start_codon:yes stop_codon:yes gene_type:complete